MNKKTIVWITIIMAIIIIAGLSYIDSQSQTIDEWVFTLPQEEQDCIKTKIGMQELRDIDAGKVMDTNVRSVVEGAGCHKWDN